MKSMQLKYGLGILLALGASSTTQAAMVTTFDSGMDGWIGSPSGQHSWQASGGNDGGYVRFIDSTSSNGFLLSPTNFSIDLSAFDTVGAITFDQKIFTVGSGVNNILPYEITLTGSSGSANWKGATAAGNTEWVTVSALLNQTEWNVSGDWLSILSNITQIKIRSELVNNSGHNDIAGIDNISIPSSVPVPSALWLFGSALLGLVGFGRRQAA